MSRCCNPCWMWPGIRSQAALGPEMQPVQLVFHLQGCSQEPLLQKPSRRSTGFSECLGATTHCNYRLLLGKLLLTLLFQPQHLAHHFPSPLVYFCRLLPRSRLLVLWKRCLKKIRRSNGWPCLLNQLLNNQPFNNTTSRCSSRTS